MSQWNDNEPPGPGPGGLLEMMALALGAAAAVLLTTKQGQQVRDQIAERAVNLQAQAAGAPPRAARNSSPRSRNRPPSAPNAPVPRKTQVEKPR